MKGLLLGVELPKDGGKALFYIQEKHAIGKRK